MKNKISPICFVLCFIISHAFSQEPAIDTTRPKLKKFYIGTGTDAAIFSTAIIQNPKYGVAACPGCSSINTNNALGTLRFSYFFNMGLTFNFNLNRHLGVYTGIDLKNIGFIEQNTGGETVKRRTYNIGAPVGIKIGNMMPKCEYIFFGGGADVPINYKEKSFVIRSQKTKFNEWFSKRTPAVMPYLFAGFAINRGVTFKAQFYPGNFLNTSYTVNGLQPYRDVDIHIMLLSIGYAVPVTNHRDMVTKRIDELNTK